MKFLITSDNHLGFKETDPIRSEDSFNTFEEIMRIAKKENVDMILQSGDLFDENRPSRNTYNKTLKILREYCLGGKKPDFKSSIQLNCQNSHLGVSLPILSIHGNHDDPSGFNSVSPLDVLHSSGLINYFGRVEQVDEIEVVPILIEGSRKVAIYGIGHIKDRRIQRTFLNNKVSFKKPEGDGWYNILMLHQNRTPREDGYLSEDLIDPFFDLVIYGHEHESIKINHKNFEAIQCGSTVRTSLCEGESMEKYVYILDFSSKVLISRIELQTVRPLVIENIKVTKDNPEKQVNQKIESILEEIKLTRHENGILPLIRLRIDLSGVHQFNRHKVQEVMQGKVANPSDAIRISRKAEREKERVASIVQTYEIKDIFQQILETFDLKALIQPKIIESIDDFVEKDIKEAFNVLINDNMMNIVKNINFDDLVTDSVDEAIKMAVKKIKRDVYSNEALKASETDDYETDNQLHDRMMPANKTTSQEKRKIGSSIEYEADTFTIGNFINELSNSQTDEQSKNLISKNQINEKIPINKKDEVYESNLKAKDRNPDINDGLASFEPRMASVQNLSNWRTYDNDATKENLGNLKADGAMEEFKHNTPSSQVLESLKSGTKSVILEETVTNEEIKKFKMNKECDDLLDFINDT